MCHVDMCNVLKGLPKVKMWVGYLKVMLTFLGGKKIGGRTFNTLVNNMFCEGNFHPRDIPHTY